MANKQDPWLLDKDEATKVKNETKFHSTGEICPKRNISIGEPCKACEEVSAVYQSTTDGDPKRTVASRKSAKASYFANVVFPANQDKAVILEMGKQIGDQILDQLEKGNWLDIAHPIEGKGRELQITKSKKEGNKFPTYSVQPVLDKADWSIPESVLENLTNLDQSNLIEIVQNQTEDIFKVSSLKQDETITIRIAPPWEEARERGEKRIMTPLFRHWGGVTRKEIEEGGISFMTQQEAEEEAVKESDDKAPWENDHVDDTPDLDTPPVEEKEEKMEPCFGKANVFEEDDEECQKCKHFKKCGRAVMKATV